MAAVNKIIKLLSEETYDEIPSLLDDLSSTDKLDLLDTVPNKFETKLAELGLNLHGVNLKHTSFNVNFLLNTGITFTLSEMIKHDIVNAYKACDHLKILKRITDDVDPDLVSKFILKICYNINFEHEILNVLLDLDNRINFLEGRTGKVFTVTRLLCSLLFSTKDFLILFEQVRYKYEMDIDVLITYSIIHENVEIFDMLIGTFGCLVYPNTLKKLNYPSFGDKISYELVDKLYQNIIDYDDTTYYVIDLFQFYVTHCSFYDPFLDTIKFLIYMEKYITKEEVVGIIEKLRT